MGNWRRQPVRLVLTLLFISREDAHEPRGRSPREPCGLIWLSVRLYRSVSAGATSNV